MKELLTTRPQPAGEAWKIDLADKLGGDIFAKYGNGRNGTTEAKLRNLAADMVEIVTQNLQKETAELLAEIKNRDHYREASRDVSFEDGVMLKYIKKVKKQINENSEDLIFLS
jgi:hypothetical protein